MRVGTLPESLVQLIKDADEQNALIVTTDSIFGTWANIEDKAVLMGHSGPTITEQMLAEWAYGLTGSNPDDIRFSNTAITVNGKNINVTIERKHRYLHFSFYFMPSIVAVKRSIHSPENEFIFV